MAKFDIGTGAAGALSGAATGAAIGSVIPGLGTALGAAGGGLIGGLGSLFGSKKKKKKKSTLDPQQQALYRDYIGALRNEGPFAGLYNYDVEGANRNFGQNVSRPANRNFQENIIPSITGQFRSNNIGNSSYTGEALSRAGRDVQENLDAQRSNMIFSGQQAANAGKQNAIGNILGMNTFDYQLPRQNSVDQILNTVGPAAGEWFADYLRSNKSSAIPTPPQAAIA